MELGGFTLNSYVNTDIEPKRKWWFWRERIKWRLPGFMTPYKATIIPTMCYLQVSGLMKHNELSSMCIYIGILLWQRWDYKSVGKKDGQTAIHTEKNK